MRRCMQAMKHSTSEMVKGVNELEEQVKALYVDLETYEKALEEENKANGKS